MVAPNFRQQPLSRRSLLRGAALGGAGLIGASVLGCGSDDNGSSATATPNPNASPTPGGNATLSAPELQWTRVAALGAVPPPRYDHTLVADGTKLYLFGGRNPSPMNDLWAYDIAEGAWTQLTPPDQPAARFGHNAVWDQARGRLVIFGGQAGSDFFNDVREYDPAANAWTDPMAGLDIVAAPAPRYGAASCLDGSGKLLISHGFTASGRFDDTWQYDLSGQTFWTEVSPSRDRPVKRCLIDGAWDTLKQRLIIYGGQSNESPFMDDLWGWSLETDWQQIARLPRPSPRNLYALVYDGNRQNAYLIAGRTEDGPVADTWSFHSDGETWTQTDPQSGSLLSPRYSHDAAITPEGVVYLFGGTDDSTLYNDLWQLERIG